MSAPRSVQSAARLLLFALAVCTPGAAQSASGAEAARRYRTAHEKQILQQFLSLLELPNVATELPNIEKNAEFLRGLMEARGIRTKLVRQPGAPPLVFGALGDDDSLPTIGFYAHYDGQPVEPRAWAQSPWQPAILDPTSGHPEEEVDIPESSPISPDSRIYARSASDDKAAVFGLLVAIEALRASGLKPRANLRLLFDGEEEQGSPHLPALLRQLPELSRVQGWILCDGPVHQSGHLQVFFGARGVLPFELTVYGPNRPLHSGHYGNWAPNPIAQLASLLAAMRGPGGRVRIPGFYDSVRPPTRKELEALQRLPDVETPLQKELEIAPAEVRATRIARQVLEPALNFSALHAGVIGTNAIPAEATASGDFRLVPDQDPAQIRRLMEAHLAREGFRVVHTTPAAETRGTHARLVKLEWGASYPAYRTPLTGWFAEGVLAAARSVEQPVFEVPTLGGSVPMRELSRGLQVPVIGVPIANYDNNQHAANENLRIGHFWRGIEIYAALMQADWNRPSRLAGMHDWAPKGSVPRA